MGDEKRPKPLQEIKNFPIQILLKTQLLPNSLSRMITQSKKLSLLKRAGALPNDIIFPSQSFKEKISEIYAGWYS